ncbi:MAG: 2-C-methyl-D-erythritol 2,4-cyclodiphosphate synthase [Bacteroidales bacterium]|nr:2-C-methyl-D-erythritol 2,4-cyclodiphosphate synthase [Bacteroidales bacterium]
METKIGIGYDSHKFVEGRKLFLGGVEIPYGYGLLAHSDGDVLIHALIDAVLGALNLGDIGMFFPDTDPHYKDIRSTILLQKINDLLSERNAKIINIDSVLMLEIPKISPYTEEMKNMLSQILNIQKERISIKAKTNEGMGFVGKKEGIASIVVVLINV